METINTFFRGLATARSGVWSVAAAGGLAWAAVATAQTALQPQTISFGTLPDRVAGETDFSVSATASSGLAVAYSASGDCTVTGALVHLLAPSTLLGSCTITASQPGDTVWAAAPSVARTFSISPFGMAAGVDLYAVAGGVALPGQTVNVLGYSPVNAPVTQPGGPVLVVNQGDTVTVRLHNTLGVPTGLLFQGQAMPPDTVGVAAGATGTYSFVAGAPGTYLYEATPLPGTQYQVAMGLHGALVVRPAAAGQAYDDPATAYDREALLVLSEIDPALNNSVDPAAFDMRNYAPRYFLINGKAYPDTAALPALPGNQLLLRYVNAGAKHHAMATLGLRQNFIAKDGSLLPQLNHNVASETLAPGQTADALSLVPATAAPGSRYAVYDAGLLSLRNSSQAGFGGMLSFVTVDGAPAATDTQGPATSALAVSNAGLVTATVSDVDLGGSEVTAAEYFVDTIGANGTGTAVTPFTPGLTVNVGANITLLAGSHTLYLHGQDAAGNWGSMQAKTYVLDNTGPVTSALSLSPNLTNGTVPVALNATANDTATGGSNIGAVQYSIDGGAPVAMAITPAGSKVASATASIPASVVNGLANGNHTVSVRSQDTALNWGTAATITLQVNKVGATTSGVSVSPSPNNGARALSASQPVVRVTANVTSVRVAAAEGFIDTVGATGTGFPFSPTDGAFGGTTEAVYADIPLATVASLSAGTHSILVRGKDGGGTWGTAVGGTLVVDKQAPTLTVSAVNSTIAFGATATLNVTASDNLPNITTRQYWVDGTATPPASPLSFSGNSLSLAGLSAGAHTVYVRVRDEATNWSNVASVTVQVVQAVADTRTISPNGSASQNSDANAAAGVLTNDQPLGVAGRTARLASAPVRTAGTGTGTVALSCPASLGTAATPAVSGQTICTNGAYRVTLTGVGGTNNARQNSKRGTFSFDYTEVLNGVTSTATVTLTVN